ncbi:MAG: CHAD domain-containing protein, partial [Acidobacteria bacterium]|nr:CHAD domain-containing protein [Acidobacteriota bacterium]
MQRRHEALATHLAAARNGDVEAVHQARVASRRLREVVPVVAANLPRARRKRLERDLRRLTRALGPV